ncbi:MAG: hypothetical protein ACP5PX_06675 [Candidatus Hadarchaeum sp.]|uniref:hypothetical protein n=1 Tax=Candidatus Hadarchaeum sp. TaxID=2883567 RepID=UPI003D1313F3
MENNGSAGFLLSKLGVAFAAIAFIGLALSLNSFVDRTSEKEELELIARNIIESLERIDGLPGEIEYLKDFAPISRAFEVSLAGELINGFQLISVRVSSKIELERSLIISSVVNGGWFLISKQNPRGIIIRQTGVIDLELIG